MNKEVSELSKQILEIETLDRRLSKYAHKRGIIYNSMRKMIISRMKRNAIANTIEKMTQHT